MSLLEFQKWCKDHGMLFEYTGTTQKYVNSYLIAEVSSAVAKYKSTGRIGARHETIAYKSI